METRRRNKRKVAREQESFSLKVPPSFSPPSPNFQGALPPAPPEAISGPLFAAAEVAPGAGDRLLLRLVCEMIRAKSSCFFVFVFFCRGRGREILEVEFFGVSFFPSSSSSMSPSLSLFSPLRRISLLEIFKWREQGGCHLRFHKGR